MKSPARGTDVRDLEERAVAGGRNTRLLWDWRRAREDSQRGPPDSRWPTGHADSGVFPSYAAQAESSRPRRCARCPISRVRSSQRLTASRGLAAQSAAHALWVHVGEALLLPQQAPPV